MDIKLPPHLFASANGFSGFRSNFARIFKREDYGILYILKGGPGTGKSTFMKNVADHFELLGAKVTRIHCSSDPSSLDGIIIATKDKKCAIIDGTAPHESDAEIPGAIDEIINLGDAWDADILRSKRDKILELNKNKKLHYKCAYDLLSLAGEFFSKAIKLSSEIYLRNKFDYDSFLNFDSKKQSRIGNSLTISSFGKEGYRRLYDLESECKKVYSVTGVSFSEALFMKELLGEIEKRGISYTAFISPFSDEVVEGVYLHDSEILFDTKTSSGELIETSRLLKSDELSKSEKLLSFYRDSYDELLRRSAEEFRSASIAHFALEAIYRESMDFEKLSTQMAGVIGKIESYLFARGY